MENAEEIFHSLDEYSKVKPKVIPRELEEYLMLVAKTGDPIYQWTNIKYLIREKLISVITDFYETCPSVEIPPCPNVEAFNYENMKNFILEKLDSFTAAPFTVQRICELLTTPRKEYNRIDKYMRALEKNVLVVSTCEPGRRSAENGENNAVNGIDLSAQDIIGADISVDVEMNEATATWPKTAQFQPSEPLMVASNLNLLTAEAYAAESTSDVAACTSSLPDYPKAEDEEEQAAEAVAEASFAENEAKAEAEPSPEPSEVAQPEPGDQPQVLVVVESRDAESSEEALPKEELQLVDSTEAQEAPSSTEEAVVWQPVDTSTTAEADIISSTEEAEPLATPETEEKPQPEAVPEDFVTESTSIEGDTTVSQTDLEEQKPSPEPAEAAEEEEEEEEEGEPEQPFAANPVEMDFPRSIEAGSAESN